jgi:hypothetical protein
MDAPLIVLIVLYASWVITSLIITPAPMYAVQANIYIMILTLTFGVGLVIRINVLNVLMIVWLATHAIPINYYISALAMIAAKLELTSKEQSASSAMINAKPALILAPVHHALET